MTAHSELSHQVPASPARSAHLVELAVDAGRATVTGTAVTDWDTAAVRYNLTGPRLAGTWTVRLPSAADSTEIITMRICFGVDAAASTKFTRRDKPVVNGIEIMGSMMITDRDTLTGHGERFPSGDQLPRHTAARLEAVVRAIADHLLTNENVGELHRRAAVLDAITQRAILLERLVTDQRRLEEITTATNTRCDYHRALLEHYDNIAAGTVPPGTCPTSPTGEPLTAPPSPRMYAV
ncbi:hypothetical protein [Nocardia asiatica]